MTVWLSFVDAVSDLTKLNWPEVFNMSVMEFFAFLSYQIYKNEKEKRQFEEWKRKNRVK